MSTKENKRVKGKVPSTKRGRFQEIADAIVEAVKDFTSQN